ncbi:MAG: oligosaccharide flippase family protein [Nanoarchaeota archaeon]
MNARENSFNIRDQIIKNSFWNVINSGINRVGSFILVILLSRILMPEGFGRYSLALTVALFFMTFSDMGINQTLIRYASMGINKKNGKSSSYFRYLLKIKFFLTLFLSGILLILSYPLSFYIFQDSELFIPLLILSFYVFLTSLTGFFESLFFIKKNVRYISFKESALLVLKLIAISLIGYLIIIQARLVWIFLSFVILSMLTFFFDFYFSKRAYPNLFQKTKEEIDKKEIRKFILSLNVQNIALTILAQAGILFLGIFLPAKYVGYYNSSLIIVASLANLFLFSSVFLPILTNMKEDKFRNFIKKIFRLFFLILLPLSFGLSILSRFFIFAIYGEDYLPAWISLSVLAFLIPCIVGVDLSLVSFSSKNKLKSFSRLMLLSTLIFIFLNYIFLKIFLNFSPEAVLVGASIAALITWLFCFIFSVFLLKKELNLQVISSWIFKPILSCIIMSGFLLLFLRFGEMTILKGIFSIVLGALIYLICLFLVKGIKKEEIASILKIILSRKN